MVSLLQTQDTNQRTNQKSTHNTKVYTDTDGTLCYGLPTAPCLFNFNSSDWKGGSSQIGNTCDMGYTLWVQNYNKSV